MDEVDRRMSETIKSTEVYPEDETPFDYEISSNGKDEGWA